MSDKLQDRLIGAWSPGGSLDEIIALARSRLPWFSRIPGVGLRMLSVVVLLAVVGWLSTGVYKVQPDEQGVVLRFGRWMRDEGSGPPLPLALSDRDRAAAESHASQPDPARQRRPRARRRCGGARPADADRRREHRRGRLRRFLEDQGRRQLPVSRRRPAGALKIAAESAHCARSSAARRFRRRMSDKRQEIADETRDLLQAFSTRAGRHPGHAGAAAACRPAGRSSTRSTTCSAPAPIRNARATRRRPTATTFLPRARGEAEHITAGGRGLQGQVDQPRRGRSERFLAIYEATPAQGRTSRAPVSREPRRGAEESEQGHHRLVG